MNAPHSSMRSVASTLVATAGLVLVSVARGATGPAGVFVRSAVRNGPEHRTTVTRAL